MKLKHIYTIIVALLLFTGCAENEIYEDVNGTSHELVPLRFSVSAMAEVETRGTTVTENEIDTVGIFLLTEREYNDLLDGKIVYKGNVPFANDSVTELKYAYYQNLNEKEGRYALKYNAKFYVDANDSLKAVDGDSLYYSTNGGTAVFAYTPYDKDMTKEKLFQGIDSISDDQTTDEKVLPNDFRLATPVRGDKTSGNPIVSYQRSISLHFRHQLSRIVLKTSLADLKEMCWNEEEDADRIVVCVDSVPVSGKRALANDGLNYSYSNQTKGMVHMASYSLSEVLDSIYPNVLVVPTENKVVPRFKLFFYKGEDTLKVVGLTVRNGQVNVKFGVGGSLNFNCTYGEEDKLRDAFARGLDYTLTKDVELTEPLKLGEGKSVTLNLNGHTISMEKECTASFEMIKNMGTLTIVDEHVAETTRSKVRGGANEGAGKVGRISFKDIGVGDSNFGWGTYTISNYGTLTVNGGVIENISEQNPSSGQVVHMYCAIQQPAGSTIVNGGCVSNPTYRSIRINKGALIVNGGTMEGQVWLQPNQGNATLEVTGGEFSPRGVDGSSIFMTNIGEKYTVPSAKISGGKFNTKIGSSMPDKDGVKGCVTGGTFTQVALDGTDRNLFAEETYLVKENDDYVVKHSTDETQDLLTAFRKGDNYQLTEDVILIRGLELAKDKTLALDLNGHSISHEMKCTASYNMITNKGTLSICGEGKISFTDTSAGGGSGWGSYTLYNYGTLEVNDATIVHNGSTGDWGTNRPTDVAINNYQGKVTVNSGTISSKMFRSLRDFTAGGEIVINGGKFEGQVWMQGLGTGSSSLTITGGEFEPLSGYDGSSIYLTNGTNDIEFSVTGGLFNTKIGTLDAEKPGVKGSVKGGLFTETAMLNTNEALIADGYHFEQNGEYYELLEGPSILENLQNAFKNGGEYVLEGDVVLPSALTLAKGKRLVLDLNGYSISHENDCTDSYNMITNSGELIIKGNGVISFTDTSAGGGSEWGSYTIYNSGTLDVSDATIVHHGSTGDWGTNRPTNIPINNYMGKVTVNSGTISSKMFRSLRDFTAGGEIVINGGKFEGQIWMQGLGSGSSSLTITGGEFEPLSDYDGSSIYLTNGTNDIVLNVTGGWFKTRIGVADADKAGVKGSVSGGTFTQTAKDDTNAALIAEGHIFVDNGDGTYTIQENKESVGRGEGFADNTLEALSRKR